MSVFDVCLCAKICKISEVNSYPKDRSVKAYCYAFVRELCLETTYKGVLLWPFCYFEYSNRMLDS